MRDDVRVFRIAHDGSRDDMFGFGSLGPSVGGVRPWPMNLCPLVLKPWNRRPWNLRLQAAGAQIPSLESRKSQRIPMGSFRFQWVP